MRNSTESSQVKKSLLGVPTRNSGKTFIVDFGVANITDVPHDTETKETALHLARTVKMDALATDHRTVVGTLVYMSPEQVQGSKVDHRSDIFSMGVILYEHLCGAHPFSSRRDIAYLALMEKIAVCKLIPIRIVNPEISAEMRKVCEKALAKAPDKRFQTCAEFKTAFTAALDAQERSERAFGQKVKDFFLLR